MKKYFIIIPTLLLVYFLTLGEKTLDIKDNDDPLSLNDVIGFDYKDDNLVSVSYNGDNLKMGVDDYVIHVLACEMPASFNVEALKAGAVAARTFYLYKIEHNPSYVATTTDQCFSSDEDMKKKWSGSYDKFYNIVKDAVESTSGEFISYDGSVIESFYFSMSNGYTEDVQNVFSESKPYLVGVQSSWDVNLSSYEKSVTFSKSDFLSKLGIDYNDEIIYEILSRSESSRVNEILVNGIKFKGTDFRKKLNLRSTDFDIDIKEDVVITTRGYGHGVGLSQYGANEMAKLGYSYKDILKHYYTGVEISTL